MKMMDLTGKKFNRWTVLERAENSIKGQAQWLCRCECGTEKVLVSVCIRNGHSKSCGCLSVEKLIERSTKHGHSPESGASKTYYTWDGMLARCSNPKHHRYDCYGGKGIVVCEKWKDFKGFLEDMGEKPKGTSLDRKDSANGYFLENCRWATPKEQARNKTNNRNITYDGKTKTLMEWSEDIGISISSLAERLDKWPIEKALTEKKVENQDKFTYGDKIHTLKEWAEITGISAQNIYMRLRRGKSIEEALDYARVSTPAEPSRSAVKVSPIANVIDEP